MDMDLTLGDGGPEDFTLNIEKYMRQTPSPKPQTSSSSKRHSRSPKRARKATVENAEDVESPVRLSTNDTQIRDLKAELEATEAGNASIRKALEEERQEREQERHEQENLRRENEQLRRQLKDATSLDDIHGLIRKETTENKRLTASLEQMLADHSDMKSQLREASSENAHLQEEVQKLQDSLSSFDKQDFTHRSNIASYQRTISSLKTQLREAKELHQNTINTHTHQLADLEEDHDEEMASRERSFEKAISEMKTILDLRLPVPSNDGMLEDQSRAEASEKRLAAAKHDITKLLADFKAEFKAGLEEAQQRNNESPMDRDRSDAVEKKLTAVVDSHQEALVEIRTLVEQAAQRGNDGTHSDQGRVNDLQKELTTARKAHKDEVASLKQIMQNAGKAMEAHDARRLVEIGSYKDRIALLEKILQLQRRNLLLAQPLTTYALN